MLYSYGIGLIGLQISCWTWVSLPVNLNMHWFHEARYCTSSPRPAPRWPPDSCFLRICTNVYQFFKRRYFSFHCTILDNRYRCKRNLKSVTRYCERLLLKGGLIIQEIYSSNTNETSTDLIAWNTCKLSGSHWGEITKES